MWNNKNLKEYREYQGLVELNEKNSKEVVDVLNDMLEGVKIIPNMTIEPFFEFAPIIKKENI